MMYSLHQFEYVAGKISDKMQSMWGEQLSPPVVMLSKGHVVWRQNCSMVLIVTFFANVLDRWGQTAALITELFSECWLSAGRHRKVTFGGLALEFICLLLLVCSVFFVYILLICEVVIASVELVMFSPVSICWFVCQQDYTKKFTKCVPTKLRWRVALWPEQTSFTFGMDLGGGKGGGGGIRRIKGSFWTWRSYVLYWVPFQLLGFSVCFTSVLIFVLQLLSYCRKKTLVKGCYVSTMMEPR